jgi:hypothetical protein
MNWDCDEQIISNKTIILPCNFNSQLLAIEISAGYSRGLLDRSGYLTPSVEVGGELFRGAEISVGFGRQLLSIPYLNYQLEFKFVDAISSSWIRIKQLSTNQINQITNMYVNSPIPPRETGEPIYTTVTPNQANATVPVFTIVAPKSRRSVLITNKTTRTVYLKEGAAASAPTLAAREPFVSIPAGGSYTIEDWSGEIVGLMAGNFAAGGYLIVKELPYLVEETPVASDA